MEELIKQEMGTSTLKKVGSGGGCVNEGIAYETDQGKIFVKINRKSEARLMFEGEFASSDAIMATKTVRIPKPYKVIDLPGGGAGLVMEYVDMSHSLSKYAAQLGQQMADLHKHNENLAKKEEKNSSSVHKQSNEELRYQPQFGFHVPTCCGYISQTNTWCSKWPEFFAEKIEFQISRIEQKEGDRKARMLWNRVLTKYSALFDDLDVIHPALLHGDLWGGNAAENAYEPVIFDPASFYGHSEFDFAISNMFGGFSNEFYKSYYKAIPKSPKFKLRQNLYQMFHYINHWNHFGGSYQHSSMRILEGLIRQLGV